MWINYILAVAMIGGSMTLSLLFWPFEPVLTEFAVNWQHERLIIGAVAGGFLVINYLAVSTSRKRQRRQAAHEQALLKRRQSKISSNSPAAWVTEKDDLRRIFRKMDALNNMPHIVKKLKGYWGFPEFLDFTDELLTMEAGRESRSGFDPKIHQELASLRSFYIENIPKIMSPDLTAIQKTRMLQLARRAA